MSAPAAFDASVATYDVKADLDGLLTRMVQLGGSDLHLTVGVAPAARVNGALKPLPDRQRLDPADTEALVRAFLSEEQWKRFEVDQELDTAYALPGVSRFRVNVYRQR